MAQQQLNYAIVVLNAGPSDAFAIILKCIPVVKVKAANIVTIRPMILMS
jgi:hypothetical protein